MKYYLLVRKGALLSLFDPRTTFSFCMEFVFMLRMHMCFSRRHVFFCVTYLKETAGENDCFSKLLLKYPGLCSPSPSHCTCAFIPRRCWTVSVERGATVQLCFLLVKAEFDQSSLIRWVKTKKMLSAFCGLSFN